MRVCTAGLVALALAVGLVGGAEAQEEDAAKAVAAAWAEAWNSGDMDGLGALYAEDADYVGFFGDRVSGRAAIQAGFGEIHSTVYRGTKISIETVALKFVKPDIVVSDTNWKLTNIPTEAPAMPTEGQSTAVMVKQDGAWRIVAHRYRVPQQAGS